MSEFRENQRVKVSIPEFYGVVNYVNERGTLDVRPDDIHVDAMDESIQYIPPQFVTHAPALPEYWPPQLGDVWEGDDGCEWFIALGFNHDNFVAVPADEQRFPINSIHFDDKFKSMVLGLIRRRGLSL